MCILGMCRSVTALKCKFLQLDAVFEANFFHALSNPSNDMYNFQKLKESLKFSDVTSYCTPTDIEGIFRKI